jgi:co-chaperonin GroES (HSP10)
MTIKAVGHYLIVKLAPVEGDKLSSGGIVIAETISDKKRQQSGGQFAEVIDIGWNAWSVMTDYDGNYRPWCKVGDRVMIAQYSGQAFPVDPTLTKEEQKEAERMRLIKDDDVLAVEVNDE